MIIKKFIIKVWHILKSFYYRIFNKNEYLKETRLPICNVCEFKVDIVGDESICGKCGCIIKNKVLVREESCIINKW